MQLCKKKSLLRRLHIWQIEFVAPLFVFAAIALGANCFAQSDTANRVDPVSKHRLNDVLNGMSNSASLENVKGVLIRGNIVSSTDGSVNLGTFTAKLKRGHFLIETDTNGHHTKFSGKGAHARLQADGKERRMTTSGVSDVTADLFPFFDTWSSFSTSGTGMRPGTDRIIDGVNCEEIVVNFKPAMALVGVSSFDISAFIRKDNGLLRAVEYPNTSTAFFNPRLKTLVEYEDYTTTDGLTLPRTIKRYVNQQQVNTLRITAIDVHQVFDDSSLEF